MPKSKVVSKGAWVGRATSFVYGLTLVVALLLSLAGCGSEEQAQKDTNGANESTQKVSAQTDQEGRHFEISIKTTREEKDASQDLTPIVGEVSYAPIPFEGSDGRTHLVYELEATNFTSGKVTIRKLEVLDADTDDVVAILDAKEVAARLQPAGLREPVDTLAPSMTALVFLHVSFDEANQVPERLVHRVSLRAAAAPPGQQQITERVGLTKVDRRDVVVVGPPAKGFKLLGGRLVL